MSEAGGLALQHLDFDNLIRFSTLQDVMNFYDSFDVFPVTAPVEFDETAPFEPFDPHRESDIIGTRLEISGTTLAGVPLSVTVELIALPEAWNVTNRRRR